MICISYLGNIESREYKHRNSPKSDPAHKNTLCNPLPPTMTHPLSFAISHNAITLGILEELIASLGQSHHVPRVSEDTFTDTPKIGIY